MPIFAYKAKQGPDKIVDGRIDANNIDAAVQKIIQLGFTPIDIAQADQIKKPVIASLPAFKSPIKFIQRVKLTDKVQFTRQMSDLVDASVPMLRSLQIISHQTQNPQLKTIIEEMHDFVRDGGSFSESLAIHRDVFSSLYVHMVRAGEVSGQLNLVLNRLADYLEKEQETISKVRSSLAYPFLILAVGVLTVFVLLTFVIPKLSIMFEDLGQDLPLPTVILVGVSSFFARFWWLMIALGAGAGFYLKQWLNSIEGKTWFDHFKLRIPILGEFIKIVEVGRFARTLGTLVESGVVITTALDSVWAIIDNEALRAEIKEAADKVRAGSSLKVALSGSAFFPEMATNMISVGEEAGNLEKGLYKIADTYERQSDQTIKTLISLLGPLVLVGIVAIVGFVVIAMLLPIFQMNLLIQ